MDLNTIVGVTASVLTGASLLPQLLKILREKKAHGISYWMLIVLLGGVALWIWYGVLKNDIIIILSNALSAVINITIFIVTLYYHPRKRLIT